MKNNSIHIIIVGLLLWLPLQTSAQGNLNEYLETAAQNNPELKASFNQYLAALERVPQVGALPDPQVAFAYFIQPVETRQGPQQAKFSVTQMFPWFGLLDAREQQAAAKAKASYQAFEQARLQLFHSVRSAYYSYYVTNRAVEISREHLELLGTIHNWLGSKLEAGLVPAVDEYRLQMEMGDLENQLATLKEKVLAKQVAFNKLLHTQADKSIEIPDTLWNRELQYSYAQVLDSTLNGNPKVKQLAFNQQATTYGREVARINGLPDFSLGLDYTVIAPGAADLGGTDAILFPKIGITIPLNRKKYRAMQEEARLNQETVKWQQTAVKNSLETRVAAGWEAYEDATRRVELFKQQVDLTEKTLPLLQTQYASGKTSFEELLRMERKMLNYKLALEQARADKLKAISNLQQLMGHEYKTAK